jgi:hypothetical protein
VLNNPLAFIDPFGLSPCLGYGDSWDGIDGCNAPQTKRKINIKVVNVDVLPTCDDKSSCGPKSTQTDKDGYYGIKLAITYQVTETINGKEVPVGEGLVPFEDVSTMRITQSLNDDGTSNVALLPQENSGFNPLGPSDNSQNTGQTNKDGRFVDAPFGLSSNQPYLSASYTQEIGFKEDDGKVTVARKQRIEITAKMDRKNNELTYTIKNNLGDIRGTNVIKFRK